MTWNNVKGETHNFPHKHLKKIWVLIFWKLMSTFAHQTREIAHETSFHECSQNEFLAPAHETSFSPCSRDKF